MRERTSFLEKDLSKVQSSKDRLIQAVSDGLFSKDEVAKRIEEIRQLFKSEIGGIASQLKTGPTEEEVRRKAKLLQRAIGEIYRSPSRLAKMNFEEMRKLVETLLGGRMYKADASGSQSNETLASFDMRSEEFFIRRSEEQSKLTASTSKTSRASQSNMWKI